MKRILFAALTCCLIPLSAQSYTCRSSGGGFDGDDGRGGRFDLRIRLNGSAVVALDGRRMRVLRYEGMVPRDAGCEFSAPVPNRRLEGLRLEQRDGRGSMRILEEPSRRNNWQLIVAIDDPRRGDDARYHGRITWEDRAGGGGGGGGWGNGNGNNGGGWGNGNNGGNWGNNNGNWNNNGRVPGWMIGRFVGEQQQTGERIEINISPDGRVDGFSNGGSFRGEARGTEIRVGSNRFFVSQTNRGLMTEERGNSGNRTRYRRVGNY